MGPALRGGMPAAPPLTLTAPKRRGNTRPVSSTPAQTPLPPSDATPRRRPTPAAPRASSRLPAGVGWNETRDEATGDPRDGYGPLLTRLDGLSPTDRRSLDERLEATMRELGVSFDSAPGRSFSPQGPWLCDALPQLFTGADWDRLALGLRQRLRAFECFLQDIYVGEQEILRAGVVPIPLVLGSASFQRPAVGLTPPLGAFLHAGSMSVRRDARGELLVASHHFAQSNGLACMVQNRRVLARVAPELFEGYAVASLSETPTLLLETARDAAADLAGDRAHGHQLPGAEPTVVLLTPGPLNPFYAEHGFLARRMGVPLVQGGDLLVLDDCLYLKTISGLERVHVVLNRVADGLLDPLVLQRGSLLGVPGLVHCLRKKTVAVVNGLGARLADDRSLLPFAHQIIRFYTGEAPILRTVPTFWLGDLDQREMVVADLAAYRVQPLVGERPMSNENALRQEIRRSPHGFVAQRAEPGARAVCYERGRRVERHLDHLLFALRRGPHDYEVSPGALTRLAGEGQVFPAAGLGGGTKDTWVLEDAAPPAGHAATVDAHSALRLPPAAFHPLRPPPRRVTSRAAESLYWLGRYGERAVHLAYLLQAVETLETEELNAAERRLYRPMWNRLLPHLDASPRRSISTARDRYRLVLEPDEPGALVNVLRRTLNNAEGIQDTVSPEAWGALSGLRATFARQHFFAGASEAVCARVTRKLAELTTRNMAQFYGLAESTMLDDDGWRFCRIGQQLERAIITANAALACAGAFAEDRGGAAQEREIELSAFLRLLGTRDAYRRVFQMRAEGLPVLQLLFQHPEAPRSVLHCAMRCAHLLRECCPGDPGAFTLRPLAAVEGVCETLRRVDWPRAFEPGRPEAEAPAALIRRVLAATLDLHNAIADSFLNHQAQLSAPPQLFLAGFQGNGG